MKYIILEGADGTGKTTLAKEFAKRIGAKFTYEPFGIFEGEEKESFNSDSLGVEVCMKLREFCLSGKYKKSVNWRAREYMMLANRAITTERIKNDIESGQIVVQDRSLISGMVFAKVASGMKFSKWWTTASEAFWIFPELVVHVVTEKQNIKAKGDDIYDSEKAVFHKKIKETFPEAIDFIKNKKPMDTLVFENNFNKSPQENARDLAYAITEHFGVTYH